MPKIIDQLRSNLPYEFIAVGIVWAVVAVFVGSALVLWPALTCIVAGATLKIAPSERFTWSWATSAAVLGFLVCGYQVYVSVSFLGGAFSAIATETLIAFLLFALVHLTLLFAGYSPSIESVTKAA